jgi:hypothetical protein
VTVKSRTKLLSKIGVTAAFVLGLAMSFQSQAASAAPTAGDGPVVTVTPSSGLNDGDVVTVSASGLAADTVYHVGQCAFVDPQTLACNQPDSVDATTDSSGSLTATLRAIA